MKKSISCRSGILPTLATNPFSLDVISTAGQSGHRRMFCWVNVAESGAGDNVTSGWITLPSTGLYISSTRVSDLLVKCPGQHGSRSENAIRDGGVHLTFPCSHPALASSVDRSRREKSPAEGPEKYPNAHFPHSSALRALTSSGSGGFSSTPRPHAATGQRAIDDLHAAGTIPRPAAPIFHCPDWGIFPCTSS